MIEFAAEIRVTEGYWNLNSFPRIFTDQLLDRLEENDGNGDGDMHMQVRHIQKMLNKEAEKKLNEDEIRREKARRRNLFNTVAKTKEKKRFGAGVTGTRLLEAAYNPRHPDRRRTTKPPPLFPSPVTPRQPGRTVR